MEEKNKKKIIVLVAIFILIAIGIWRYYHYEIVKECKRSCFFIPSPSYGDIWRLDDNRFFPTQKQCIDYCVELGIIE